MNNKMNHEEENDLLLVLYSKLKSEKIQVILFRLRDSVVENFACYDRGGAVLCVAECIGNTCRIRISKDIPKTSYSLKEYYDNSDEVINKILI